MLGTNLVYLVKLRIERILELRWCVDRYHLFFGYLQSVTTIFYHFANKQLYFCSIQVDLIARVDSIYRAADFGGNSGFGFQIEKVCMWCLINVSMYIFKYHLSRTVC